MSPKTKVCTKCEKRKPVAKFEKHSGGKHGLRAQCRICVSERTKKYRDQDLVKERRSLQAKERYEANREEIIKKHREYRAAHRKQQREYYKEYSAKEENKTKKALYSKEWRKNNPHLGKLSKIRRAERTEKATPVWLTPEHKEKIKKVYLRRDKKIEKTGDEYHVDHIVPLQGEKVCGLHVPWNLRVITAEANLKKNNRHTA